MKQKDCNETRKTTAKIENNLFIWKLEVVDLQQNKL